MVLDINDIPEASEEPVCFSEVIFVPDSYSLSKNNVSITVDGVLCNTGAYVILEGRMSAVLESECAYCAKPVTAQLSVELFERFSNSGSQVGDEVWSYSDKTIDCTPALETNLYLNIPIRFVCREECKGLCQSCGHDLNEGSCGCGKKTDPRFDILKNFKFE